jgi:hypothetical protein
LHIWHMVTYALLSTMNTHLFVTLVVTSYLNK